MAPIPKEPDSRRSTALTVPPTTRNGSAAKAAEPRRPSAPETICIVTVFNNVIARLRRMGTSLEEASADLGAGIWTTFRLVTFPQMGSALFAGALLAFALSFDEIIVTTFTAGAGVTTLPIWILDNLFRPNQAPIVNVIAVVLVLVSIIPIWIAQRITAPEQSAP